MPEKYFRKDIFMKIKTAEKSFEEVMAIKEKNVSKKSQKPKKPNILFRTLVRALSAPELISTGFKCNKIGMERLGKNEPCFILMNHSSFIDMKIAYAALYPRPFNIVCSLDAFVGKNWLMKQIGCIPTKKFVAELGLLRNISYSLNKLNSSVLMYPEAGYSFDGTATTLPDTLGKFVKMLGVPLIMIRTYGAFSRDPLYNNLRKRKVKVSCDVSYLLSPDEIKEKSPEEINAIIAEQFSFDNFRWQQENGININAPFRTDYLHRVLYRCPDCETEGEMYGKGIQIKCKACGKVHWLNEEGFLETFGEEAPKFDHIPDWFKWERECVRREIERGDYYLKTDVDIYMMVDTSKVYRVGEGELTHSSDGFKLRGCDGKLSYEQKPIASYSICADYYWYEIGDVICIGNNDALYFCFPKDEKVSVAKVRLAAEELYKIAKEQRRGRDSNPKE